MIVISVIINNIKMFNLYQKALKNLNLTHLATRTIEKQSAFYEQNRKEVLRHYRYLLKTLPKFYDRKLQQRHIYLELTHLFHVSKVLNSIEETQDRASHLREFVKSIEGGDYSVLGSYPPARAGEYIYLKTHLNTWMPRRLEK